MWPQGFPLPNGADMQVFMGDGADSDALSLAKWRTWTRKPGQSRIFMLAVGGGGGGNVMVLTRSGGGGAACSRLLIQASLLPETIYILPGRGGIGANQANATSGESSYIAVAPSASPAATTLILRANGGGGATTSAVGAAGTASVASAFLFANYGLWSSSAGQAGATGNITPGAGSVTTGGAGGNSGQINATANFNPAIPVDTDGYTSLIGYGPKGQHMVCLGGPSAGTGEIGRGGPGCGGGGGIDNPGGPGFVIVMGF